LESLYHQQRVEIKKLKCASDEVFYEHYSHFPTCTSIYILNETRQKKRSDVNGDGDGNGDRAAATGSKNSNNFGQTVKKRPAIVPAFYQVYVCVCVCVKLSGSALSLSLSLSHSYSFSFSFSLG